jgi:ABC-type dipeptide/oligopeptide/nickel transport system permease subunit
LASRRTIWTESLADLFLLPADVLLFLPAVPTAIAITIVLGKHNVRIMILATAIVLLPRAFRVVQTLWMTAPTPHRRFTILLAGVGSLFFGTMFFALWTVAAFDFLGVGVQHPLLSLSTLMKDHLDILFKDPATPLTIEGLLWICPFTCYIIADALIGFFSSKDVMTHLNQ